MNDVLEAVRGRLMVSCQAYPGEAMDSPEVIRAVALATVAGGAAGLRVQGIEDIAAVRAVVELPLVGLWKDGQDDVFITPTLDHALAVAAAGADVVAVDGTQRPRPDGRSLAEVVEAVHARTGKLVMADCSTFEEGVAAAAAGADLIGTTLSGYTPYTTKGEGPDLDLVARLADTIDTPVAAEGRIHTPDQAAAAIAAGAWTVVVGTAITHPTTITSWFTQRLEQL
ncbi:N-acetylmannosamine-6-phosphate 2-epimerase [Kribbella sp. HUAS MG21]|jgi:N-acylglucosamine-6-phosphate 2-epimerase|uniref:Putative N-acetylmannosamine-6-phosphate 2-epimerase n=1 Tax=Kribbella sp. HUAS MG21 TaxID=3160966 RepID=A0AAU7T640_9ACTN